MVCARSGWYIWEEKRDKRAWTQQFRVRRPAAKINCRNSWRPITCPSCRAVCHDILAGQRQVHPFSQDVVVRVDMLSQHVADFLEHGAVQLDFSVRVLDSMNSAPRHPAKPQPEFTAPVQEGHLTRRVSLKPISSSGNATRASVHLPIGKQTTAWLLRSRQARQPCRSRHRRPYSVWVVF